MKGINRQGVVVDKKKLLREQDHLTRPPRLEGVVKEAMMQPIKKSRSTHPHTIKLSDKQEYTE